MSIINILILTSMIFNMEINGKKGFNFVAATLDQICNWDVSSLDDICNDVNPDERGNCCPNIGGGEVDTQQYCHDDNQGDSYCSGGLCTCQSDKATPVGSESYGVATCTGTGCGGLLSLSCEGIYFGGLCVLDDLEGLQPVYTINENATIREQTNIFVKEKFDWFLTKKGELIPAQVIITVW